MKAIVFVGLLFLAVTTVTIQAQACGGGGAVSYAAYTVYPAPGLVVAAPLAPAVVYSSPVVYRPSVAYSFGYAGHGYYPAYHASPGHWPSGAGYQGRGFYGGGHKGW